MKRPAKNRPAKSRLAKWFESQKNKPIKPKRSISPKDESNDDSISKEEAIIKVQIEFEFDSVNVKNLTRCST